MRLLLAATLLTASALSAQERHILSGTAPTIWNLAGVARLEPGTGNDIVVTLTRGGPDGGKLEVSAARGELKVRYPSTAIIYDEGERRGRSSTTLRVRRDGTFGGGDWGGNTERVRISSYGRGFEGHADLTIQVPRGKSLRLHLAVGRVEVRNVEGELSLDLSSASVIASGTKGRIEVDAGSGSIELRDAEGELTVDTGSGSTTLTDVRLRSVNIDAGSGSVRGTNVRAERFKVDVGSGRVGVDALTTDDLFVDTGSGSVNLGLTRAPRTSEIDTGSGSVTITLPASVGLDLDIETGSGGITTDFPVTMNGISRRSLRGTIGDGSGLLRVSTGSGGVRLRKALD